MARSTQETDSGMYINGVYTSKNGNTSSGGLNCPKGTRLYDPSMIPAIFYMPEDRGATEVFNLITRDIAPDILPCYALSNYGRIMNVYTGLVMKPNYRPNGYEYYCMAAENCKTGQKKYTTHRMVMKEFRPLDNPEDMEKLQVNHINHVKSDNYVDKTMPDGTIQDNLEWMTASQNCTDRSQVNPGGSKLSMQDAKDIREMHQQGYSYGQISKQYPQVCSVSIENVCKNKTFKDPDYVPRTYEESYNMNPANVHRLTNDDATRIRALHDHGFNNKQIKEFFYPNFSESTVSDIVRGISYRNAK